MRKILLYLNLGKIGFLEILFALYPILAGYQYGLLHIDMLTVLIMDMIAISRPLREKKYMFKPLQICVLYAIVHELVLIPIVGLEHTALIKNTIQLIIIAGSIFIIAPKLNYQKFLHSLMWIALLSSLGIVYHFIELQLGHICHPLKLPFMPDMSGKSRLYEEILRPTSFFWEPAAYVTFMMLPFFLQLQNRKYLSASILLFFILFSTSTNGIALGFLMLVIYVFTQNVEIYYKVIVTILGCFMLYFMLKSSLFEAGIEKMDSVSFENEVRIINGPNMVFGMNKEHWIFGFPKANFDDYVSANPNLNVAILNNGGIFLSTFWNIWAKYGIISLIIYLFSYFKMVLKCRELLPYVVVLFAALFTQSIPYSNYFFLFQMTGMLVFMRCFAARK
ncbi:hypothetical protein [Parabacteroides sp.]|uniref:hypothetical protein n=1 Tax=Parabacteroides sp. TaxID=1869337 RepID=UPI0025804BCC|nr:hypothetical protein [Parabacteroides sp.]